MCLVSSRSPGQPINPLFLLGMIKSLLAATGLSLVQASAAPDEASRCETAADGKTSGTINHQHHALVLFAAIPPTCDPHGQNHGMVPGPPIAYLEASERSPHSRSPRGASAAEVASTEGAPATA